MRGESFQNAMSVIVVVVLLAAVPLLLNATAWWPLYVPVLAAIALSAYVFLPETDIAAPRALPEEALRSLEQGLTAAGVRATQSPKGLTVRMDALSAVRLQSRVTDQGTAVSYRVWATPLGVALVVLLVALAVTAIPAVVLLAVLWRRAKRFALTRTIAFMSTSAAPPAAQDEIHELLVGGLSSAGRLARQAYEAGRSAYWDLLLDILLAGALAWVAILIGLFVAVNGFNILTGDWTLPLVGATVATVLLVGGLVPAVRGRYLSRLSEYAEWENRLGLALAREGTSRSPGPAEPSSIELLMSASERAPEWIEAQRKAGMSADPAAGFVLLTLSAVAFSLAANIVAAIARGDLAVAVVFGASAVGIGLGAAGYARHWSRLQAQHLAGLRSDWDSRARALRERLDGFLGEM